MRLHSGVLSLVAVLCTPGCSDKRNTPAPSELAKQTAVALPPSVDLSALMDRAHFAFRAEGPAGFVGGHTTYRSSVADTGALTVRAARGTSPLSISTLGVWVGARRSSASSPSVEAREGVVVMRRGEGIDELVQNRAEGVEQKWRFERRPGSRGEAVRVEVSVSGAPFLRSTPLGHHFGREGAPLIRYGQATWVDAEGERTPLPVAFAAGKLTMTVPADLLERSTFPAELDPLLTPERLVDQPVIGSAFGDQTSPDLAFGQNQFLLVWTDTKSINGSGFPRLMGARLDAAGVLLDPIGVVLFEDATLGIWDPHVASDGVNYLVSFTHDPDVTPRAWTLRVSAAGVVSAAQPLVSTGAEQQRVSSLTFGSTVYLVTWEEGASGSRTVKAARLDAAAAVQGAVLTMGAIGGDQVQPGAAFDATGAFLVVWRDEVSSVIRGARVTTAGVVLDLPGSELLVSDGGNPQTPTVGFNGATFDVGWIDGTSGTPTVVPVTGSGAVGSALPLVTPDTNGDGRLISGNGSALYLYSNSADGSLRGVRLTSSGQVLDPTPFIIAANADRRSSVATGCFDGARGRWLTAWRSEFSNFGGLEDGTTIRGALVAGATGAATGLGVLTKSNNAQAFPAIAWAADAGVFLVAWSDLRAEVATIRGARVGLDGTVKDPMGIEIISSPSDGQLSPAVASDGRNFAVTSVSLALGPVTMARLDGVSGAVLDTPPKVISNSAGNVHGARIAPMKGGDYLVTWLDDTRQLGCSGFLIFCGDVFAARVRSSDGLVAWRTNLMAWGSTFIFGPSAAWDGAENDLVTWTGAPDNITRATRIDSTGAVLDTPPLELSPLGGQLMFPAVSAGAGHYLVTFTVEDGGVNWQGSRRVAFNGTMPEDDAGVVSAAGGSNYLGFSAFDGQDWVVAWTRGAALFDMVNTGHAQRYDGATMAPLGAELLLGATSGNLTFPTVVSDGHGTTAILYVSDDSTVGQSRTHLRFLRSYPSGHACSGDTECRVGSCVEGVCCNSACGGACQTCLAANGATADGTCGPRPAARVCRPAVGPCDAVESCSGSAPDCPADATRADSTACGASGQCTLAGACQSGQCLGAQPRACVPSGECREAGACIEPGGCPAEVSKQNGTACSLGQCEEGVCVAPLPPDAGVDAGVDPEADAGADPVKTPKSFGALVSCAAVPLSSMPWAALAGLLWLRRRPAQGGGR